MKTHTFVLSIITLFSVAACDLDEAQIDREEASEAHNDGEALVDDGLSEDPSLVPPEGPFDLTLPEPEPSEVSCPGWPYGAWCMARCSNGGWYAVGHQSSTPYGQCTSRGQQFCGWYGMGHTGACWGSP